MTDVRPIDANALIKTLLAYPIMSGGVLQDIREQPTIDYAPVRHGEWTTIDSSYWRWKPDGAHPVNRFRFEHTECGKVVAKKEHYCPRCGAKMDGGKSDG